MSLPLNRTMNPEIKAEWLKRLRDPETKQTTGSLCRTKPYTNDEGRVIPEGMCCLGVLTEIAVERGIVERSEPDGDDYDPGTVGYAVQVTDTDGSNAYRYSETGTLPAPVIAWAGLPDTNPWIVDPQNRRTTIATFNDAGHTFAEIADIIDAQF